MVVDNLAAHKGEEIRESIEARGDELLLFLPDYNPIEETFSKIKALLCGAEARTREALIEAMGTVISAFTGRGVRGFYREHCGYRLAINCYGKRCKADTVVWSWHCRLPHEVLRSSTAGCPRY